MVEIKKRKDYKRKPKGQGFCPFLRWLGNEKPNPKTKRKIRLKGNGKFWLQHNAEIILHARCQWLSGNWNNFGNSIFTNRIYSAFC